MKIHSLFGLLASLALTAVSPASAVEAPQGYHLIKKVVLGGAGGWDYLIVDPAARRLYISRSTHVMVVDADTYAVVGDIPATDGVHGIAVAADLGRGFTSNGRAGTVTTFDLKTLQKLAEAKAGKNPDAIVYDPASRRVFACNGGSQDVTVVDAASGRAEGTIALGGKPEFAAADGKGRVYVNIEDKSEVVAIDARRLKVQARWPLAPCAEPSGMGIDAAQRRLFIGCHNKMMAVLDADSGKVLATPAIGAGVDANAFDAGTRQALSSNGDGTLTVVSEETPEKFSVAQDVATQKGARTMALDAQTHRVFLVTADFAPAAAATTEHPHQRPSALPGTFTLLVFGE
jgi:DNA-binding beta-propeller fold protein YncE